MPTGGRVLVLVLDRRQENLPAATVGDALRNLGAVKCLSSPAIHMHISAWRRVAHLLLKKTVEGHTVRKTGFLAQGV